MSPLCFMHYNENVICCLNCVRINSFQNECCIRISLLNAEKMLKIYQKANSICTTLYQWFISWFISIKGEDWILQENNDLKHRSRLCTSWKEKNNIETFDWPSQSPDANPIENV